MENADGQDRPFSAFESRLETVSAQSLGKDIVELCVIRTGNEQHECPETVELSMQRGILGDRWTLEKDPTSESQVTLMMTAVAKTVACDQPLHLPGDNFLVNIDLSVEALPVGTHLQIGTAELVVSEVPHTGCAKFSKRFGSDALRWINDKTNRGRRLRGVNCRIVKDGIVSVGDSIAVITD